MWAIFVSASNKEVLEESNDKNWHLERLTGVANGYWKETLMTSETLIKNQVEELDQKPAVMDLGYLLR